MSKIINNPIGIELYSTPHFEPFWENKIFQHVSELFPNWLAAEIMLETYVYNLGDWAVSNQNCEVLIGPKQPLVRDELTHELFPMWYIFPPEDRPLFLEIYSRCVKDFTPDTSDMLGQKLQNYTLYLIESRIKSHNNQIQCYGGPNFRNWLRFNLGLDDINGLRYLDIKIVTDQQP
jgi:hypothetical protein